MTLLAPLWLLLLAPWAVLWAWRGWGGPAARVPFLRLWPRSVATVAVRRRRPPLWAMLLLSAVGLAIVAAAGPARMVPAKTLMIVVDNGPALTPARLRDAFARLPIDATTRVHVVPGIGEPFDQVGGVDVSRLPRSALADEDTLRRAARRAARQADGAVVVVADHVLTGLPTGVSVVTPPARLTNAGIDRFAVAEFDLPAGGGHKAQAMVRVVNDTPQTRARLKVDRTSTAIDLPAPGGVRDYFIDLPPPGEAVTATLLDEHGGPFADDVPADDRAYVARTTPAARVEPRGPLPPAVGRLLAVYAARRPSEAGAVGAGVVTVGPALGDGPGVRLAESFVAPTQRPAAKVLAIDTAHPVTRTADLRELVTAPRVGGGPADDGRGAWRTLVRDGDDVLLAVRESPARQAWVGVDTTAIAGSPAFVVLWTDLLDWLGGGAAAWTNGPWRDGLTPADAADASLAAGPGFYRDGDRTVAVAMPAVRSGDVAPPVPLPTSVMTGTVSLSPPLLLVALALVVAGLGLMTFTGRREASPGLTRP